MFLHFTPHVENGDGTIHPCVQWGVTVYSPRLQGSDPSRTINKGLPRNVTPAQRRTCKTLSIADSTHSYRIGIVEGAVQLGPLGTAATNRPIVPAPGDYDGEIGGMMIGRENRSIRRKPAPVPLCQPQTPLAARTRNRAAAVGNQRLTA
jgi:hypothetical protein